MRSACGREPRRKRSARPRGPSTSLGDDTHPGSGRRPRESLCSHVIEQHLTDHTAFLGCLLAAACFVTQFVSPRPAGRRQGTREAGARSSVHGRAVCRGSSGLCDRNPCPRPSAPPHLAAGDTGALERGGETEREMDGQRRGRSGSRLGPSSAAHGLASDGAWCGGLAVTPSAEREQSRHSQGEVSDPRLHGPPPPAAACLARSAGRTQGPPHRCPRGADELGVPSLLAQGRHLAAGSEGAQVPLGTPGGDTPAGREPEKATGRGGSPLGPGPGAPPLGSSPLPILTPAGLDP